MQTNVDFKTFAKRLKTQSWVPGLNKTGWVMGNIGSGIKTVLNARQDPLSASDINFNLYKKKFN